MTQLINGADRVSQPELLTTSHDANFLLLQFHCFQIPEAEFLLMVANVYLPLWGTYPVLIALHPSIHSFQQLFTESLPGAKLCVRGWRYSGEPNRIKHLFCRVDIPV